MLANRCVPQLVLAGTDLQQNTLKGLPPAVAALTLW
jgi:hypothetical protein